MQFIAILAYCSKLENLSGLVLYRATRSVVSITVCKLELLLHISYYLEYFLLSEGILLRVHLP